MNITVIMLIILVGLSLLLGAITGNMMAKVDYNDANNKAQSCIAEKYALTQEVEKLEVKLETCQNESLQLQSTGTG